MLQRFGKPFAICAILPSLWTAQAALAQEATDPIIEELHGRAAAFLEEVSQDRTEVAYQELLRDSPLLKQFEESEQMKKLIEKTKELKGKYGECRKIERVVERKIGTNLILLRYLYQCEVFPVVWHFVFYRVPPRSDISSPADQPWRLVVVRFDTELERLAQ